MNHDLISHLLQLLEQDPGDADVLCMLGDEYAGSDDRAHQHQALRYYSRSVQARDDRAHAYRQCARLLSRMGCQKLAVALIENGLNRHRHAWPANTVEELAALRIAIETASTHEPDANPVHRCHGPARDRHRRRHPRSTIRHRAPERPNHHPIGQQPADDRPTSADAKLDRKKTPAHQIPYGGVFVYPDSLCPGPCIRLRCCDRETGGRIKWASLTTGDTGTLSANVQVIHIPDARLVTPEQSH